MEANDGVLPEDAHLMPATRESSLDCVGDSAAAAARAQLYTDGKASRRGWLWRRGEARRGLSAGSWGAQAAPGWQLSGASLSFVVVASAALGAGAAYVVNRRL